MFSVNDRVAIRAAGVCPTVIGTIVQTGPGGVVVLWDDDRLMSHAAITLRPVVMADRVW